MTCELFTQRCDLFFRDWTAFVPPLLPNVSKNVGDFLIAETFPRLHDGAAEFLSLNRDRSLQAFHHDHGVATRTTVSIFRTGKWRIALAGRAEAGGLMANRAVREENFFAAIDRGKLRG